MTNNLKLAASTIAAIYKARWQIELFFKALKQNLKIKTFVGTSPNAVHIQIWTALYTADWPLSPGVTRPNRVRLRCGTQVRSTALRRRDCARRRPLLYMLDVQFA